MEDIEDEDDEEDDDKKDKDNDADDDGNEENDKESSGEKKEKLSKDEKKKDDKKKDKSDSISRRHRSDKKDSPMPERRQFIKLVCTHCRTKCRTFAVSIFFKYKLSSSLEIPTNTRHRCYLSLLINNNQSSPGLPKPLILPHASNFNAKNWNSSTWSVVKNASRSKKFSTRIRREF